MTQSEIGNGTTVQLPSSEVGPPDVPVLASPQQQQANQNHRPINIATISAGFEKGDFLVREEKGQRVYFDFFEEAFNYISNKGYARMTKADETEWFQLMDKLHNSIKGGMKYNTGKLLMVLSKPVEISNRPETDDKTRKSTMETFDNLKQYTGDIIL